MSIKLFELERGKMRARHCHLYKNYFKLSRTFEERVFKHFGKFRYMSVLPDSLPRKRPLYIIAIRSGKYHHPSIIPYGEGCIDIIYTIGPPLY